MGATAATSSPEAAAAIGRDAASAGGTRTTSGIAASFRVWRLPRPIEAITTTRATTS